MKRKGGAAVTGDKLAHKRQAVEVQEGEEPGVVRLPMEMVCAVLGWVGVADLSRCALVCRQWHAILSPPPVVITISDDEDDSQREPTLPPPVGRRLWQRAYFNTWPLPPVAAFQLPPSMASSKPLPPQPVATMIKDSYLIKGSDEEEGGAAPEPNELIYAQEDVPEERDWREMALTRLRLHHQNVDASFVARSCADKLRRLGSAQTDELADALRAGLKQAELQKRIAKVKRNSPTGKGFHGTHKLLMANTYWTQLHTTVKRCDVGEVKHKASMVAYSLITGLPFHASVVRSGQCNIDNDYDYDEDKDWCQLYLGAEPKDDYGEEDATDYDEAFFERVMSRASAYLFGQHGARHQQVLEEFLFSALDLAAADMVDLAHPRLSISGPWSENLFLCWPEDLDAQGRLKKRA